MKVRALRGVCIGPGSHVTAGDIAEVDNATGHFLVSIGAVEVYTDPPAPVSLPEPVIESPAKPGKKEKFNA
jgi:hypothetical protein